MKLFIKGFFVSKTYWIIEPTTEVSHCFALI